ncbi:predicted protein [Lodderomyces elongisporus NRRL YB-4239]|uniref:Uncharacterized protein n=1 Tax=Lodderomyces elongisporus (strain ATCC 11503 / CBS 2605 / JCM 1781 / NBRC 1676 / NRRL YB-4239) TaxID=379508 RepID=A5DVF6_LODEL|nr:predicted protein [Lodderomyces elongisporus NRRL YB-4239]
MSTNEAALLVSYDTPNGPQSIPITYLNDIYDTEDKRAIPLPSYCIKKVHHPDADFTIVSKNIGGNRFRDALAYVGDHIAITLFSETSENSLQCISDMKHLIIIKPEKKSRCAIVVNTKAVKDFKITGQMQLSNQVLDPVIKRCIADVTVEIGSLKFTAVCCYIETNIHMNVTRKLIFLNELDRLLKTKGSYIVGGDFNFGKGLIKPKYDRDVPVVRKLKKLVKSKKMVDVGRLHSNYKNVITNVSSSNYRRIDYILMSQYLLQKMVSFNIDFDGCSSHTVLKTCFTIEDIKCTDHISTIDREELIDLLREYCIMMNKRRIRYVENEESHPDDENNDTEEEKAPTLDELHLVAQDSDLSDVEGGLYSEKKDKLKHDNYFQINQQHVHLLGSEDTDAIAFKKFVLKAVEKESFDQVTTKELYQCNKSFIVKQVNKFMEMKRAGNKKVAGVKPSIAWDMILVPGLNEGQINTRFNRLLIKERIVFMDGKYKSIPVRLMRTKGTAVFLLIRGINEIHFEKIIPWLKLKRWFPFLGKFDMQQSHSSWKSQHWIPRDENGKYLITNRLEEIAREDQRLSEKADWGKKEPAMTDFGTIPNSFDIHKALLNSINMFRSGNVIRWSQIQKYFPTVGTKQLQQCYENWKSNEMIAEDEYGIEYFKGGLVNYLNKPVNEEGTNELNGILGHKLNESRARVGLSPLNFKAVNFPEKFFTSKLTRIMEKLQTGLRSCPLDHLFMETCSFVFEFLNIKKQSFGVLHNILRNYIYIRCSDNIELYNMVRLNLIDVPNLNVFDVKFIYKRMIHNREIIRINGEAFRLGNFEVNDEMNFSDDKPMINEINNRIQANLNISWKNIEKNSDYKYTSDRFKNRFDNLKANLKVIEIKGVWQFHQRYFLRNGVEKEVSSDSNSDDEAQLQSVSIQESEPPKIKNVSTATDAINPNSSCLDQSASDYESSDDNATLADFGDLDVNVKAAVNVGMKAAFKAGVKATSEAGMKAALRTGIIAALQSISTTQSRSEANSGNPIIHNNSIQGDSLASQVESDSDSDASLIDYTQSLDDEDETEPIATPKTSKSRKIQSLDDEDETEPIATPKTSKSRKIQSLDDEDETEPTAISNTSNSEKNQSLDDENETEPTAISNTSNREKNLLAPLTIVQSLVDAESLDSFLFETIEGKRRKLLPLPSYRDSSGDRYSTAKESFDENFSQKTQQFTNENNRS